MPSESGRQKGGSSRVSGIPPSDVAAERWIRRLEEGLSVEEEIDLADWLSEDPAHEASLQEYRAAWARFEPLARAVQAGVRPEELPGSTRAYTRAVDGASERSRQWSRRRLLHWVAPAAGLAAVFLVLLVLYRGFDRQPLVFPPLCEHRTLTDGSVVELNRGAQVTEQFSVMERRVRLEHGEAIFHVTKDSRRPFIVQAGTVEVRAVGTAFNVRWDRGAIEVVVTEGLVRVLDGSLEPELGAAPTKLALQASGEASLGASQSAVVGLQTGMRNWQVRTLTPAELEARLAWKPKLLEFDNEPLSAIVAAFNRRNPVRLVVNDPAVADRRMTASFRSDNLEAFVRLVEMTVGVKAKWLSETEIALARD